MKKSTILILALAALIPLLAVGGVVLAQSSASYNLEWHVIGGGQPAASASYVVNSTAGQGAASPPTSASASYSVSGGYWFSQAYQIYLPLVLRNYP